MMASKSSSTHFLMNSGAFWAIKQTRRTPAHGQCNAQVKNFNRQTKEYLSPFLHDNTFNWENLLPAKNFAYNTSFQSTIGTTSFQLLYGLEEDTPGPQAKMLQEIHPTLETNSTRLQILASKRQKAIVHSEHQNAQQKRAFNKHAERGILHLKPYQPPPPS